MDKLEVHHNYENKYNFSPCLFIPHSFGCFIIIKAIIKTKSILRPIMLSTNTGSLFKDMQRIADKIKSDVENQLHEAFRTFEVIEDMTPEKLGNDENAFYRMKIKTDDNGHVKVKTMQKDPGTDWKVEVEEYDKGSKSIEGSKEKNPQKSIGH